MNNYRKQSIRKGKKINQSSFDEALLSLGFNLGFGRGKIADKPKLQNANYTGSFNK